MVRGLLNWRAEDVMRFLKKYGFSNTHMRGSHMYYSCFYNGQERIVTIPFHKGDVINPKTLRSIIIQSGIPKEEWLDK